MNENMHVQFLLYLSMLLLLQGCAPSIVLQPVDFSQPVEMVLTPDEQGMVQDIRRGLSFSILPIQQIETGDTSVVSTKEVRVIRDRKGYYYLTAPGYRNVYILAPGINELRLKKAILITQQGISKPAFNQRSPYIQLVDIQTGGYCYLSNNGIIRPSSEDMVKDDDYKKKEVAYE